MSLLYALNAEMEQGENRNCKRWKGASKKETDRKSSKLGDLKLSPNNT